MKKTTILDIKSLKNSAKIVCLTAYTAPMAKILDQHVDILLVGDSLGMVVYGFDSTLPVTTKMMENHGAAVVRGSEKALTVVDLPFGSYQKSKEQAFKTAAKMMQRTGCDAVKLEGGSEMAETIAFLTSRGIPVMAHIGLQPQSVNALGGYKAVREEEKLLQDAKAVEEAGAFATVIEGTQESIAAKITAQTTLPTIGIGASLACDGQVLVTDDLLGLFADFTPKFVEKYATLNATISDAIKTFAADVRAEKFPTEKHCFK
ncbi:MAG: 3-methyl-2-oxobutanoate hydroxymethyltransferase [Alphaproteobacteria bacterium]